MQCPSSGEEVSFKGQLLKKICNVYPKIKATAEIAANEAIKLTTNTSKLTSGTSDATKAKSTAAGSAPVSSLAASDNRNVAIGPGGVILMARSKKNKKK